MSALNVAPFQQGLAKWYYTSATIAAGTTSTVTLNVPSGYIWIVYNIKAVPNTNTKLTYFYIDGNEVSEYIATTSALYLSSRWGGSLKAIARSSVGAGFSNTGTADESVAVHVYVIEIPESYLSE